MTAPSVHRNSTLQLFSASPLVCYERNISVIFRVFFRFRFRNAIPVSILTSYPVLDPVRLSRFRSPDVHPISGSPSRRRRVTVVSLSLLFVLIWWPAPWFPRPFTTKNTYTQTTDISIKLSLPCVWRPPSFLRVCSAHDCCAKTPILYISAWKKHTRETRKKTKLSLPRV